MLRNIVLVRCNERAPEDLLDRLEAELRDVEFDGRLSLMVQRDAGLRSTSMDFAVISDFVDGDSYERYDSHPDHIRIRDDLLAPFVQDASRIQLYLDT
jgi:hypothetical protein